MNGIIRRYAIATPFIVPKKTLTINIRLQPKKTFSLIGMGGSILGAKAIYSFLKQKIKKNCS